MIGMQGKPDAIVIGANLAGAAAAAWLARAGKRVILLEAGAAPREPMGALDGLDPELVSGLQLFKHGLRFSARDLPLVGLRDMPLTLARDLHAAGQAIAAVSDADAKAYVPWRQALLAQARQLRQFWWRGLEDGAPHWVLENRAAKEAFDRLCLTGADAWLRARFESDALVSTLLWDAIAGGLAPSEPGSALALVWRASGEMAGLQSAASCLPVPGSLMNALRAAGRHAALRCYARVAQILIAQGAVRGVTLDDGEILEAPLVLSALSRDATDRLLGHESMPGPRLGEAQLLLSLSEPLDLKPARYRIAEHVETYLAAHEEARAGQLPRDMPLEFVPLDPFHLAVTLRPFPAAPPQDWRAQAAAQAIFAIGRHVPGLAGRIANVEFHLAVRRGSLTQLLAPAGTRIRTGLTGLYVCGEDAEPLASVSGRAARIAASLALGVKA